MQGTAAQERQAMAEAVAEGRIRTVAGRGGGHAATAFPSAARPPTPQRAGAGGCVPNLAGLHQTPTPSGRYRSALLWTSPATRQLALLPRLATVCRWLCAAGCKHSICWCCEAPTAHRHFTPVPRDSLLQLRKITTDAEGPDGIGVFSFTIIIIIIITIITIIIISI